MSDQDNNALFCSVCELDEIKVPGLIIARWRDMWICTDCLEDRPGKAEAEAQARGERQPLTQQQYRDHGGGCCLRCQSEDIGARRQRFEAGIASQDMVCYACELRWTVLYRLAGYAREAGTAQGEQDWEDFLHTEVIESPETEG